MKYAVRKISCLMLFAGILMGNLFAESANAKMQAIDGLVSRILPGRTDDFKFEIIEPENGNDVFELAGEDGDIVIAGNSPIAQAVGLNWYLKYYCNTTVSWQAADPIELPKTLPTVEEKIRKVTNCDYRFFLNYCTFGYTMPWWGWQQWEHFIDWMALNGINTPLAITGQEAIWQKVWSSLGLTDSQIRGYFTAPAHLPWHRMGNIDKWNGPMPQSYIDNQLELQKRILAREREYGMKPVLPAFAGHVPPQLGEIYPDVKINELQPWCAFSEQYSTHFLDPMEPLFTKIQQLFLIEQTKQFGTDHIYGTDPFNEMVPPSWEPEYLAGVSSTIYNSIASIDAEAKWLQMAWLFVYKSRDWTNERIEAMLRAVPQGKMILLDYYCEKKEIWKITDAFFDQPYIWCYLGNFGGNTFMVGDLDDVNSKTFEVFSSSDAKNISGIGSTLEGFDLNPVMYNFVFERAWNSSRIDLNDWIADYAKSRVGSDDENFKHAWRLLAEKIYVSPSGSRNGAAFTARPSIQSSRSSRWANAYIDYDNRDLLEAWSYMLKAENKTKDSYLFDLVNVADQCLSNYSLLLRDGLVAAYKAKDLDKFNEISSQLLELLNDIDALVATRSERLLGRWLEDAKSFGIDKSEQEYYEHNARVILTTWGEQGRHLNDYANRNWASLIKDYYAKRWQLFIDSVRTALIMDEEFDEEAFFDKVTEFEWNWTFSNKKYPSEPVGDSYELAKKYFEKYAVRCCGKDSVIVAHRGASGDAPENTVISTEMAFEQMADKSEIDIYLSKDNRIMVLHDKTTKRTCSGVEYEVANTNSDKLRELDAGSWKSSKYAGEKIPFIKEVIEVIPEGKKLFIEIKCGKQVAPFLKQAIEESGKIDQMEIISGDLEVLAECKKLMPSVPVYWVKASEKDKSTNKRLPYDESVIQKALDYGLDGLDLYYVGLTKDFVQKAHDKGLEMYVWTVNDIEDARRMIIYGVDGITTDYPGKIRKELGI